MRRVTFQHRKVPQSPSECTRGCCPTYAWGDEHCVSKTGGFAEAREKEVASILAVQASIPEMLGKSNAKSYSGGLSQPPKRNSCDWGIRSNFSSVSMNRVDRPKEYSVCVII